MVDEEPVTGGAGTTSRSSGQVPALGERSVQEFSGADARGGRRASAS